MSSFPRQRRRSLFPVAGGTERDLGAPWRRTRGRKPVVVGVGFNLPVAVHLATAAEEYGADGILVLPPSCANATDEGLFEYSSPNCGGDEAGCCVVPNAHVEL